MVIWKTIGVPIIHKCKHVEKVGGKLKNSFVNDLGEIPIYRLNEITNKWEVVVNNRGRAYAARNRLKYKPKKKSVILD